MNLHMPRVRLTRRVQECTGKGWFDTTEHYPWPFAGPASASTSALVSPSGTLVIVPSDALQFEVKAGEITQPTGFDAIVAKVAEEYKVTSHAIKGKGRGKKVVEARHVAMYLCVNSTCPSQSLSEVGRFFHTDHTTVKNAINRVWEKRENLLGFKVILHKLQGIDNSAQCGKYERVRQDNASGPNNGD